jgi:hypothetical protein
MDYMSQAFTNQLTLAKRHAVHNFHERVWFNTAHFYTSRFLYLLAI